MTNLTLYRCFDAAGVLLYVGITGNPYRRWEDHSSTKAWWTAVRRIAVEHFNDAAGLVLAERRAIRLERPMHNVAHRPSDSRPRQRAKSEIKELRELLPPGPFCLNRSKATGEWSIRYVAEAPSKHNEWRPVWSTEVPISADLADWLHTPEGRPWEIPPSRESVK